MATKRQKDSAELPDNSPNAMAGERRSVRNIGKTRPNYSDTPKRAPNMLEFTEPIENDITTQAHDSRVKRFKNKLVVNNDYEDTNVSESHDLDRQNHTIPAQTNEFSPEEQTTKKNLKDDNNHPMESEPIEPLDSLSSELEPLEGLNKSIHVNKHNSINDSVHNPNNSEESSDAQSFDPCNSNTGNRSSKLSITQLPDVTANTNENLLKDKIASTGIIKHTVDSNFSLT